MRIRTSLLAGMAGLLLALPPAAQACDGAGAAPRELSPGQARATVLCLVNEYRRQSGLRPVSAERRLERAAQRHSASMDALNYFSHNSPGGGSPVSRIRRTGYLAGARSWAVGEVIRWGQAGAGTPKATVSGWMASPPHRSQLLSGRFRHIGIGMVVGSPAGKGRNAAIYTADFGARSG
jgi:uncharacterized protein YkwD